jgi:hypothetical protein
VRVGCGCRARSGRSSSRLPRRPRLGFCAGPDAKGPTLPAALLPYPGRKRAPVDASGCVGLAEGAKGPDRSARRRAGVRGEEGPAGR